MKVQPELMSAEVIQWAGMPNPAIIFHSDDWTAIPFSLMWGGFFFFWEAGSLGYWVHGHKSNTPATFMAIWGIPFIIMGQYMIWGRFIADGWSKRKTYSAITDRRVLVVQEVW